MEKQENESRKRKGKEDAKQWKEKKSFTKEEPKEQIEMKKTTKILTGCVKIKLTQTQH